MHRILLCLASLLAFALTASADPGDIRVDSSGDLTRIVIETDRAVIAEAFQAIEGDVRTLTIGLNEAQRFASSATIMSNSGVSTVQSGLNRVVFTLDRPLHIRQIKEVPPLGDAAHHRVIVDLVTVSSVRFDRRARQDAKRLGRWLAKPVPEFVPVERPETAPDLQFADVPRAKKTIVIDAGHGGRDPGTTVSSLIQEKEVVLRTALILRDRLADNPDYDVRLVRSEDVYLDHEDRVGLARNWGADLFISLHADSVGKADIRGAAVYTLNKKGRARIQGTSKQNNWDIPLETGEPVTEEVGGILDRLTIRETLNNSAAFAEILIPELKRTGPILRSGHREANLFVLLAPDVPAVLIELGFLSNRSDARRLASENGRLQAAIAIERAIDKYFEREPTQFVKN